LAYAWAGQDLDRVHHVKDLLSPGLWLALSALALLPWVVRWALTRLRPPAPGPEGRP